MSIAALRVVVAEDELLVREGIERILEAIGVDVVGTAADLPGLENAVAQLRPEVVITDIRLPPTYTDEGIRFAVKLRETAPEIGVLVLSKHVDPAYATAVFGRDGRRRGYMLKQRIADRATFEEALAAVALGGSYLDVQLVGDLLDANQRRRDPGLDRLTPRERQILGLMAEGKSNVAIARELVVTTRAVERHVGSIFAKFDLHDPTDTSRRVLAVLAYLGDAREPAPEL